MAFTVNGQPVDIKYIKSVIDAIGPRKFIKFNPWFDEMILKKPQKQRQLTADQRRNRTLLAHSYKEWQLDMRSKHGWSVKDCAKFSIAQKALNRRERRQARDNELSAKAVENTPWTKAWREYRGALHKLNNSYKFKKPQNPQLWKNTRRKPRKDLKKKLDSRA